ncbi:MAG: hypothetical protein A2147_08645, partial [Chloroflexi bacterium RBG_16_57_8]
MYAKHGMQGTKWKGVAAMRSSFKLRLPALAAVATAILILTMMPAPVAMGSTSGTAIEGPGTTQALPALTPIEQLGKAIFFDANLSKDGNQSCATCHDPAAGYAGGSNSAASQINAHGAVYPGSDANLFGNRKPPSAAYAGASGLLTETADGWVGGMFWDGRADGGDLGDPLAEQAKGPFLNPLEMALTSPEELRSRVAASSYAGLFRQVWGANSLDVANANTAYDQTGRSIAAYERSTEVNPYTSKFDKFWDTAKSKNKNVTAINVGNWTQYRKLGLTDTELYGLAVFNDPNQADCASCHILGSSMAVRPLFTDYSYDNIGVPKNPENPFYTNLAYNPQGAAWEDIGLGKTVNAQSENGKMKVPTLRNV